MCTVCTVLSRRKWGNTLFPGPEYSIQTIGCTRTLRRGRPPPLSLSIDLTVGADGQSKTGCEGVKEAVCGLWSGTLKFVGRKKNPSFLCKIATSPLQCLSNTAAHYSTHFQRDNPALSFGLLLLLRVCTVGRDQRTGSGRTGVTLSLSLSGFTLDFWTLCLSTQTCTKFQLSVAAAVFVETGDAHVYPPSSTSSGSALLDLSAPSG